MAIIHNPKISKRLFTSLDSLDIFGLKNGSNPAIIVEITVIIQI
jgi:hypothetical protein